MPIGVAVFFNEPVVVETWQGEDGQGRDRWAAPTTVLGYAEQRRTLVRLSDTETVTAQSVVYTFSDYASMFTVGSKVTCGVYSGKVVALASYGSNGLPLPEHIAVTLG